MKLIPQRFRRQPPQANPVALMSDWARYMHATTIITMGVGVLIATGVGFSQSWAGLYGWGVDHGLTEWKAISFPGMVDTFIIIGELGLFALALEGHQLKRGLAWADLILPLALATAGWVASVLFNIGHVDGIWQSKLTAAVPPVASMLGLFVLLRTLHRLVSRETATPTAAEQVSAPTKPRHVICSGPRGTVFLRRPKPSRSAFAALGGPEGSRVWNVGSLLSGLHTPVVYFIRNGSRIKIGTTQNLRPRISTLCLSVSDIEFVLHGGADFERSLHERFADYRVTNNREWFQIKGDLAAFVRAGGIDERPALEPETDADNSSAEPNSTHAQPTDIGLEAAVRTAFQGGMRKTEIMAEFNLKRWRVDRILNSASTDTPTSRPEPLPQAAAHAADDQPPGLLNDEPEAADDGLASPGTAHLEAMAEDLADVDPQELVRDPFRTGVFHSAGELVDLIYGGNGHNPEAGR